MYYGNIALIISYFVACGKNGQESETLKSVPITTNYQLSYFICWLLKRIRMLFVRSGDKRIETHKFGTYLVKNAIQ